MKRRRNEADEDETVETVDRSSPGPVAVVFSHVKVLLVPMH